MKWKTIFSSIFIIVSVMIIGEVWKNQTAREAAARKPLIEGAAVYMEGDEISALLPMEDSLWVGGKDGIRRVNYETGELLDYAVSDIRMIYAAGMVISQQDESIWIGHNDGITVLQKDGSRWDCTAPQMKGGRVNGILETPEGMYVGTMEGCTFFSWEGDGWEVEENYDDTKGLASSPVNVISQSNGEIWFGSYLDSNPGGISIRRMDGSWSYLSVAEGLPHPYINAILPAGSRIFVGTGQLTAGGLAEIEKVDSDYRVKDCYNKEDRIPGEKIRQLYQDKAGHIWITTESNGLILCSSADEIRHPIQGILLDEDNGLSDNEIKCITETQSDYWLGGRYGLTRIPKNVIEKLLKEEKEKS